MSVSSATMMMDETCGAACFAWRMTLVSASSLVVFRSSSSITSLRVNLKQRSLHVTYITFPPSFSLRLLPLADEEADQFDLTGIAVEEPSPLQNLVTRNNVSKAYDSF